VVLVSITVLAAVLRFWRLGSIPPGFHYDESLEALEAWRVLTVPGYHPIYFPGDFGLAPTFIYLDSIAFRLFPPLPVVTRAIAAVIGTLTVPAIYALGREMTLADDRIPPATPLLAALILAILRWHITFSRMGIEAVLVPLYLILILWALFRGLRTNGWAAWLATGLAVGFSVYSYPAAWLLPPLFGVVVLYLALTAPARLAGRGRGLAAAAVLAVLIIAPLALTFAQHPGQSMMRIGQVSALPVLQDTGSGAAAPPAQSTLATVGTNALKALGLFSFTGDIDPRNNIPGAPALDPLLAVPFYLGVILALWRWKRSVAGVLLLAAAAMLAATTFSQYTPHFRRAIGLTPVIALTSGLALAEIWGARRRGGSGGSASQERSAGIGRALPVVRSLVVVAILLGSAVLSTTAYFVRWGASPDLFYAYDEGLWQIGEYVKTLPPDQDVLVTPDFSRHPTLAFAWREGPAVRFFDGRKTILASASGRDMTYIVVEHEDFRTVKLLRELYPDVTEIKTFFDRQGEVYARVLHVPAGFSLKRSPKMAGGGSWPGIQLVGYDLDKVAYHPGEAVYLQLWWRVTSPVPTDWTVFTHLLGPAKTDGGILWAGKDARPGQGSIPTTTWKPGDVILDEYPLSLSKDAPAGEYPLEVGLYDLAAAGRRAVTTDPPGQDHLILGKVRVE
jgi:uncharacterized membrane protein